MNKNLRDYSKVRRTRLEKAAKKELVYALDPKLCLVCSRKLSFAKSSNRFCSHSCRAKLINTTRKVVYSKSALEKLRALGRELAKNYPSRGGRKVVYRVPKITLCVICSKEISYVGRIRKTCSTSCFSKNLSLNAKKNKLGGETNYCKFKYNGIWMDSSWEVSIATWLDLQGIAWERDKSKHSFQWEDLKKQSHTYYPDFYLPAYKLYLDPKNEFLMEKDKVKLNYVREHYSLTLLVGSVNSIKEGIIKFKEAL